MTGWQVILEGTEERPPAVLTDEVPAAFVAVPNIGDLIEGPLARFIVTRVAHCEETPDIPAHVRKQLEGLAAQPSPMAAPPSPLLGSMKVGSTALAVVARAQLQPRPLCKIYVMRDPFR